MELGVSEFTAWMNTPTRAVIVGLVVRDDAALDRVDDGAPHNRLRRAEHLRPVWLAPLMVTLLKTNVSGFVSRFGETTTSAVETDPSLASSRGDDFG